jgi:hypothetical protein
MQVAQAPQMQARLTTAVETTSVLVLMEAVLTDAAPAVPATLSRPVLPAALRRTVDRKYTDRKFLLVNGLQLGMAVFDVGMTQSCIASHHCREANPLMPSSLAGQLSVAFASTAYETSVSYWLKRRKSRLWWILPASGAAAHAVGVASGFEHS